MVEFVDYNFYKNTYKGDLSSSIFSHLINDVYMEIDKNINQHISEYLLRKLSEVDLYKLKYTACMLCDFYNSYGKETDDKNKSVSIDGVSVSGNGSSTEDKENAFKKIIGNLPHCLTVYL